MGLSKFYSIISYSRLFFHVSFNRYFWRQLLARFIPSLFVLTFFSFIIHLFFLSFVREEAGFIIKCLLLSCFHFNFLFIWKSFIFFRFCSLKDDHSFISIHIFLLRIALACCFHLPCVDLSVFLSQFHSLSLSLSPPIFPCLWHSLLFPLSH